MTRNVCGQSIILKINAEPNLNPKYNHKYPSFSRTCQRRHQTHMADLQGSKSQAEYQRHSDVERGLHYTIRRLIAAKQHDGTKSN